MVEYTIREQEKVEVKHLALEAKKVRLDELEPNKYNPNVMSQGMLSLLMQCITRYGFLFPILASWDEDLGKYRIIDGYHRYEALKRLNAEEASIIDLGIPYHDAIQLTILMNRIKGFHRVEGMSQIVMQLENLGLQDTEIQENLGMEDEEYIRLKQQLGIAHAFRNHEYSKSWVDEKPKKK